MQCNVCCLNVVRKRATAHWRNSFRRGLSYPISASTYIPYTLPGIYLLPGPSSSIIFSRRTGSGESCGNVEISGIRQGSLPAQADRNGDEHFRSHEAQTLTGFCAGGATFAFSTLCGNESFSSRVSHLAVRRTNTLYVLMDSWYAAQLHDSTTTGRKRTADNVSHPSSYIARGHLLLITRPVADRWPLRSK